MKKKHLMLLVSILFLFSCASLQGKWDKLSPDAKSRIIINDLQGQLDNAFTQGKAWATANPSKQEVWKQKVVPAFDVANKALADVILLGKTKPLSPDFVYMRVQNQVNSVVNLLIQLGAIK